MLVYCNGLYCFAAGGAQAAEKDFVKSEQRRYRRRVKQLKQQLESTNAVCSSVQDALLAQVCFLPCMAAFSKVWHSITVVSVLVP